MASQTDPMVILMPAGRRGRVAPGTTVLDAARELSVAIESICGGKLTCGKCLVRIEQGTYAKHGITSDPSHVSGQSAAEQRLVERMGSADLRCACTAAVTDDVLVYIPEASRGQKQIIRKGATERIVTVDPAVRQVYVQVDRAQLGEHRGDWGRLQAALAEQWALTDLSIDLHALRALQATLRRGEWAVTVTVWQEREVIDVRSGYAEGIYGLAVDIGSTTIAGHLCDLRTGAILATESMMNPQITYGEDLMSRVSYAMTHANGTRQMHQAVIDALNRLAAAVTRAADLRAGDIHDAVFVGNTTMVHLLLGIDPSELGGAPFALANRDAMDIKASQLGLKFHRGAYIHVLPAEAGHVGADNVAVLLAEAPYKQSAVTLTVDVGTNAEIVLGNDAWQLSASSPTGPAFEGAQVTHGMRAAPGAIERVRIDAETLEPRFQVIGESRWSDTWSLGAGAPLEEQPAHLAAGICGSGIIEVVAEMARVGIIAPDGRFATELTTERVIFEGRKGAYVLATAAESASGTPIIVTQDDVRNIQLAKAALYAGCKLLMRRAGVEQVERIVLAGAFGSYIDPRFALMLGLVPDCRLDRIRAAGNAAGDGARIALLNQQKRREAQEVAVWTTYVETAVDPAFQDEFVNAIHIPHAVDTFPTLNGAMPPASPVKAPTGARRRRRRLRVREEE